MNTAPVRIQLRRVPGWRKPENTVNVARPSRWGNPFTVAGGTVWGQHWSLVRYNWGRGVRSFHVVPYETCAPAADAIPAAVALFRTLCEVSARDYPDRYEQWIAPLRGRNLACWCKPAAPCHADVLLELAGAPRAGR